MPDLALRLAMAALAASGFCLSVGLLLVLDGFSRGYTSLAFEAIIFTTAIVALVCAIFFD
jgi:hypothetical protein